MGTFFAAPTMPSVAPMLIDISMSPESSALTCVLSPRNSTTSTSSPDILKKPFSTATYGVIDSSEGGLNEEPILIFALCALLNEGNANRPQAIPVNADFQFMLDLLPKVLCLKKLRLPCIARRQINFHTAPSHSPAVSRRHKTSHDVILSISEA